MRDVVKEVISPMPMVDVADDQQLEFGIQKIGIVIQELQTKIIDLEVG